MSGIWSRRAIGHIDYPLEIDAWGMPTIKPSLDFHKFNPELPQNSLDIDTDFGY
jgi:hypothetical protein